MIIYDFSDEEDGKIRLIEEGAEYVYDEDLSRKGTVLVEENEIRLLDPYCADEETVRKLFRLDVTSWNLAREGKYPFAYDSDSFEITEEDLKCFCERVKDAETWTLRAWHKAFTELKLASCHKEAEPYMSIGTLWGIMADELGWFDFEDEDCDYFLSWYKAYEANKGRLLSEMNLTDEQKADFCSYLVTCDRYPSAEEIKAYRKYLDQIIESGNENALLDKAWGSYGGNLLLDCDWKEAERCLLKMHELGIQKTDAANALGYIYYSNRLGEPDYGKAFRFFSEAAEAGEFEAKYKLADMYRKGHGVEKDFNKAFSVYKKLYDKVSPYEDGYKLPDIALRMGYCYENGEGVEKDLIKARYYFVKAEEAIKRRMEYGGGDYGDDVVFANIQKALERTKG